MRRSNLLRILIAGLQDSGLTPDLIEPILEEAQEGSASAQFIVGSAFEKAAKLDDARHWYQLAADQGYVPARAQLRRIESRAA